jgi:hypothetical protein
VDRFFIVFSIFLLHPLMIELTQSLKISSGVGFVPHATVAEFIELVLDQEKRKTWDTADFYDVVATIDSETDVCHVGVPSYGPISARDFVSVRRSIIDKAEDSYTAVQVSIEFPLTGREHMVKKHVRGTLLPSCWKFIQREDGCETHYICTFRIMFNTLVIHMIRPFFRKC